MTTARRPWYTVLYVQVLIAIAVGIIIGHFFPDTGVALKPLGDGFISLIKMMIAPVIFCTVVHGIGSMRDLKKVGRVGVKTLFYFEAVSTLALVIGLVVGKLLQPGKGFDIDPPRSIRRQSRATSTAPRKRGFVAHLAGDHPRHLHRRLCQGRPAAGPAGLDPHRLRHRAPGRARRADHDAIEAMAKVFFGIIGIIVRAAPIGAFGAMAFTVGAFGVGSLVNLVELIVTFYLTSILFVLVVLGIIARFAGFSILRFIGYIKDELLIVLGTSLLRDRAAAHDPEDGAPRRLEVGRRPGDPDRLQLQSRRHQHLHDAGDAVPGAGHQHAADDRPGARHPGHRHDHVEGRLGRHRRGLRHARRDARDRARHPDPVPRASCSASTSS